MKKIKTKILIVTRDYPPSMGGIQIFTRDLYQGLKKSGFNTKLLSFDGRNSSNLSKIRVADFFYNPATHNNHYPFMKIINPFLLFSPGGYREFVFHNMVYRISKEVIKKFKPDIIHLTKGDLYPAVWNSSIPFVVSCHAEELLDTFPIIYSLTHAGVVHCVTEYSKKRVSNLVADRINTKVVYNSVHRSLKKNIQYRLKKDIIITICRLIKRKNVDRTIQAFSLLPDEVLRKYKYEIIGTGPESKNLQRLAVALGVKDKVIFRGSVTNVEKWRRLREAKVFVMCPTEYKGENEGFGIVYIEAQAVGLPVIGSYDGGVPEAVGKGGIIVRNELDPNEIATAINNIVTNNALYNRLVKQANRRILNFNDDRWIQKMLFMYMSILPSTSKI